MQDLRKRSSQKKLLLHKIQLAQEKLVNSARRLILRHYCALLLTANLKICFTSKRIKDVICKRF